MCGGKQEGGKQTEMIHRFTYNMLYMLYAISLAEVFALICGVFVPSMGPKNGWWLRHIATIHGST